MIFKMKFLIIVCLFLVLGCNNSNTKKNAPEVKSLNVENVKILAVELSIKGMTCTGCEQTIQTGISSIKGVKQVKANFKDGKAYVSFESGVADTIQMKEKITASGYELAAIQPIPLDTLRSKL